MKLNWKRWLIVVYLLSLMAFTTSVLLIPGEKYNTLTTSDSGWVYDIAVEMDNANGFVDNNPLSHAPYGLSVGLSEQGQPLMAVMLYRAVHAVSPDVSLMDIVRYWSPLLFALALIPIFLIGKELGGDISGCTAAFFASVLTGSIYWMKVGAFDREAIQLLLGVWTIYLAIRLFKAPRRLIPIFAVLGGLVYGLFGLSWGGGALYLAPVIVGGLVLCLLLGFIGKLVRGSKITEAASRTGDENAGLVLGVVGMIAVTALVMYALGGMGLSTWIGFIQTLFGYVPISTGTMVPLVSGIGGLFAYFFFRAKTKTWGYAASIAIIAVCALGVYSLGTIAGGGVSFPRYAGEMAAPGSWGEIINRFYEEDLLTKFVLIFVALALAKICWSRKRWELLMIPWLIIVAGLVWPNRGQVRFDRMWWPFVAVAAGTGAAALISLFKWLSRESMTAEWVRPLQKPVVIALCFSLVATPFIINAYDVAGKTTPPTEWHGFRGIDEALVGACAWLRENTPENSIVSIEWSFGHLLTGASRRASVCDGCEIAMEEGKWENEVGIIKPPDYIYYVSGATAYIYGINASVRQYQINGRRIDVQRLPIMGEDEFRWIIGAYRDNFNVKIDYVVFNYTEYYQSYYYYYNTQPANILLSAERIKTQLQSPPSTEGQNYVFNFGEDRENVVLDTQTRDVYLRIGDESLHLDGYGALVVTEKGEISSYGEFYPPPSIVDIPETLLVFLDANNNVVGAWLIEGVSAEITGRLIPMGLRVFAGAIGDIGYLQIVYTSPNGLVKILKIDHAPSLASPADLARTNDSTPTLQWSNAIGATKYELWVDNNSNFDSPEILENVSDTTYIPTTALSDGTYSWRVNAFKADNTELGWSLTWTFTVDTIPPAAAVLHLPEDGATTSDNTPTFEWTVDADATKHRLLIDNDIDFSSLMVDVTLDAPENTRTPAELTVDNYWWKIIAIDEAGNENESQVWTFSLE